MNRRMSLLAALASLGMVCWAPAGAGAASSEPRVDRQAYVSDTYPIDLYASEPARPRVAVVAGRATAHALVHIVSPSDASDGSIAFRAAVTSGADEVELRACPVTASWSDPPDQSAPPPTACERVEVPLQRTAPDSWTLSLASLAAYWNAAPNDGFALLPVTGGTDTWRVDFDPHATTLTVPSADNANDAGAPSTVDHGQTASETAAPAIAAPTDSGPAGSPSGATEGTAQLTPAGARHDTGGSGEGHRRWWPWALWLLTFGLVLAARSPAGTARLQRLRHGAAANVSDAIGRAARALPEPATPIVVPAATALAGYAALSILLPQGLPAGIIVLGAVLGALSGLTALGLVLVFRVLRAINMAQAVMGTVAASTAVILVTGKGWPYPAAVAVGLAFAVVTGVLIEATMHRFRHAPRLIVTVATIGIAQILAAANLAAPQLVSNIGDSSLFQTPFRTHFTITPVTFTGDAVVALVTVPLVLLALGGLLTRTNTGRALRAVADSTERAELVGIPIRRILRITWIAAAALSGVAAILASPIVGRTIGVATGPEALLAPLAAAVIGRMENLTRTMVAAVGIGVAQQAFFWSYPRSSTVDVVLFVVILIGLALFVRGPTSRVSDPGLGQYRAVAEPRPIAPRVRALPEVALTRAAVAVGVVAFALAAPVLFGESDLIVLTYIVIFAIVAVSLVLLTGWAGQVTLGQFAFAGVGASCAAFALSRYNLDLFAALALGAIAAALVSVIVGMPTLRLPGQFAAVATLAFAVPASTFLLNPTRFPQLNPLTVARPELFGRLPLENNRTFYYFTLFILAVCAVGAWNIRRSRLGRTLIAVRDNDRAAAAWSISPTRARLTAFAISGAMAGLAGTLYMIGLRGVPERGFSPLTSLEVFTMVVVGGLGSLPGALLGAVYVGVVRSQLGGAAQLLATGGGLLVLLLVIPEGIGGVLYRLRDLWYGYLARRRGIDAFPTAAGSDADAADLDPPTVVNDGLLCWSAVTAGYGRLQVLFDVSGAVRDGETLALLGTNGAGKSTLLRVLAGVLPATQGAVIFDGADISRLTPQARLRAGIVTVPGGRGVFPSLTVEENLRLFAWSLKNGQHADDAINEAYATFPRLRERRSERASQLSGGEQQMLSLAHAVIYRPRLLLVDELTLGLAPATVATLLDVLADLRARGTTTIVVEQSLNTAATVATRCTFMERGRVRYDGSVADLISRDDLARAVFIADNAAADQADQQRRRSWTSETILRADRVSKRFGGIVALDEISFDVRRGEIVALIGPNGAGKTTLLDTCSGFVTPDAGTVTLAGVDVSNLPADARAELGMGRIFQDARLIPSMTVREILATALERHVDVREPVACMLRIAACASSERAVQARVEELLDAFGLQGYADSFASELSTGTRRVVEIACAVAHGPDVLLLDEPTAGVAQRETESLARRLLTARQDLGLSMLVVEHDLSFVSTVADRAICLHLGRELATGIPHDVLADPLVLEAYFGIETLEVA